MPSPKSTSRRQPEEKNRRVAKLTEKASSFHYPRTDAMSSSPSSSSQLRRPKTLPDLLPNRYDTAPFLSERHQAMKLTKILINVTIQGSIGAVQVLISPDSTVGDLITVVLAQYAKEARRPTFPRAQSSAFNLHYSQFALECLDREEKLVELGSRNFFLCPTNDTVGTTSSSSSCATQADADSGFSWVKFMDFML